MTRPLLCAVLLGALAACTSFDDIARGVCGNGLLEDGEDCDSPAATCVACAVTCGSAGDCPNAGYACGVDNRCHAPGGKLAPATTPTLDLVDEVYVSDLDHDGIGDIVGLSSSAIDVHFGDAQAALVTTQAIITPPQTGAPAVGDLDGDGALDVSIVTRDGIVAYTSGLDVLTPAVSFFPIDQSMGHALDIIPLGNFAFGVIAEDQATNRLVLLLSTVDGIPFASAPAIEATALCGLSPTGFDVSGVDVQTLPTTDSTLDVVLSVFTGGAPGANLCVLALHIDPVAFTGTKVHTTHYFSLTPTTPVTTKPVWVDNDPASDADRCPGLVDGDGGAVLAQWDGAMTTSGGTAHCGIASTLTALPALPAAPGLHVVGRIPVDPPSLLFPDDVLVMSNGLYINVPFVGFLLVYSSEREIAAVASGDLDGNGSVDAALRTTDATGLDIVYRADHDNTPGYVVQRFGTPGVVTSVQIADFDGNGFGDVAYTEKLIGHDGLSVAYSDPGHTLTAAQEGSFPAVTAMATIDVADDSDPFALVSDLVVLENLGTTGRAATLLVGSPQRTMISYFDPRVTKDPLHTQPFRALVAGHFNPLPSDSADRDLVAFIPGVGSDLNTEPGAATAYRLDGTADGLDPSDAINRGFGQPIADLGTCGSGAGADVACLPGAVLAAWPANPDHDVILGIDLQSPPHAFVLDPFAFAGPAVPAGALALLTEHVPAGAVVHAMHVVDLDGDGAPELVVAFGPPATDAATVDGLVEICALTPGGMPTACTDVATAVDAVRPGLTCVDAAPGHFAPGGPGVAPGASPDLLVLCHDGSGDAVLARVTHAAAGDGAAIIASALGPVRQIGVGDVTGDGVDDVVVLRGTGAGRTLAVLVQCSSHDAACAAAAVQP